MRHAARRLRGFVRAHRRAALAAVAVVSLLVLAVGIDAALRARDARRDVLAASARLQATRAVLSPLLRFDSAAFPDRAGYERLLADLEESQAHLQRAHDRLAYLRRLAPLARPLPFYGEQIAAGPRALRLAIDVTAESATMLRTAEPLFLGEGNTAGRAREVLVVRHAALDASLAALERDAEEARTLRAIRWRGPLARAGTMLDEVAGDLDRVHAVREMGAAAATGLDPLLGFGEPRTYIVLGQNEQEIRPTGGFVGTMGVIVLQDGRLVSSEYRSSYEFDPPRFPTERRPPQELETYMGAGGWFVRDANWDAHFPTSAERVLEFLEEDQGIRADGVIAVDTATLRLLIQATGPVALEGVAEPLTEANILSLLEEEIFEPGQEPGAVQFVRKQQVLQPVLRELIRRVQETDAAGVPPLIAALRTAAQGRDLQLYTRDQRSTALVARLGVDGAVEARPGRDFVAVVDSNISYDKIQIVIRRDITYLARADGRVDLVVQWTNEASTYAGPRFPRLGVGGGLWDAKTARLVPAPNTFGNYARIYLPPGSTFERIAGFAGPPAVHNFEGITVLGGLVVVRDGQTMTVRVTYVPGGDPAQRVEGVDFWKQGGQTRDSLRVFIASGRSQSAPHDGPFTRDLTFDFPERAPLPPPRGADARG